MEDDAVDIFFDPEVLAELGLGELAEGVVAEALSRAKSKARELFAAGQAPGDWLDALEASS